MSNFFQGRGGGSNCLFPIETQITCDFPGGGGGGGGGGSGTTMTVAWFIQHLLQFVFAFFNHSIMIAQFLFAGDHFFSFPNHFDR